MPAPKNTFKAAIGQDRFQLGLWVALASPYAAEIVSCSGYDWLLIDGEHAPNDIPLLSAQAQAVMRSGSHPIVRLPVGETWMIKQILDTGVADVADPDGRERRTGAGAGARRPLSAAWRARRRRGAWPGIASSAASATISRPPMTRSASSCRSKAAPDWRRLTRLPRSTASTACSSARRISPPIWDISASPAIRK